MNSAEQVRERLQQLQVDYGRRLPERIGHIEGLWRDFTRGSAGDPLTTARRLAHTLTGSGATLGFPAVSAAAAALEKTLTDLIDRNVASEDAPVESIDALIAALAAAGHAPVSRSAEAPVTRVPESRRGVYILDSDAARGATLAEQIDRFGYAARTFETASALQSAASCAPPAAVVMETQAEGFVPPAPAIHISDNAEFGARLSAVRAGGKAYLMRPFDIGQLVDVLDVVTGRHQADPLRVLVVDDDAALANFAALVLQRAGMIAHVATEPTAVLQPLVEFRPDLILMDFNMPSCDGLEVAAIIRQQPEYISIPIVFLSTETEVAAHLSAKRAGADDFLTKPIQPERLVTEVASRAERFRALRNLLVRDGATGLLNHTAVMESLRVEVSRALRTQAPLSFVMIDVDHFKRVNDRHGHPVGDRVLKSLARLLQQRFRKTDVVGRYGGEEFCVILPGAEASVAARIVDEFRSRFAQVRHRAPDGEFGVTFSAGVADVRDHPDAQLLLEAADQALYKAKNAGRNLVVLGS